MAYYIGFFAMDLNRMMKFYSIRKPTKAAYGFFGKVTGPYKTEQEVDNTMKVLKRAYGYQSNPAVSERQRRFMCADLGRVRSGRKTVTGMREGQLRDFCIKKNPAGSYTITEILKYFKKDVLPKVISKYGVTNTNMIKLAFNEYLKYLVAFKMINPRTLSKLQVSEFDTVRAKKISASQIRRGTEHELEHTTDRAIARKIACDHLREDPYYYTHLSKMEKQYNKNRISADDAIKITKKLVRAYEAYHKENPGKEYHDRKFLMYLRELEKYKVGSEKYIATLAKAYEHLESARDSEHDVVR